MHEKCRKGFLPIDEGRAGKVGNPPGGGHNVRMTTSRVATTPPTTHPIHTVHRVGIGGLGLFLLTFGVLGLIRRLPFDTTQGELVMGLQANGLLATVSVVVSLVLLGAAARGGHAASTVGIVSGGLFLVSGIVNMFVLGTEMNMLAFGLSNVIFSLVVGMGLLFTGAYGRISGGLAPDSPYYRGTDGGLVVDLEQRTPGELATDRMIDAELAEAERAVALHHATPEQVEGVSRAGAYRTPNDRRNAYRSI